MIGTSDSFSEKIYKLISKKLKNATLEEIKNGTEECSKNGAFVYVVYGEDCVLYVGETGTSLKNRMFNHGSGAHKNRPWFEDAIYVKYLKMNPSVLDTKHRILIEQALSIHLNPLYYNGKKRSL